MASLTGRPFFAGKFKHGVDGQSRVQFPNKWKMRTADAELVAVRVTHRLLKKDYLLVLPVDLFDVFSIKLREGGFTDTVAQANRHEYAERIMAVDLDSAGRFTIPAELKEGTGLGKEALLVGCLDRFEIWNPADYEAARERERLFMDGVSPKDRLDL